MREQIRRLDRRAEIISQRSGPIEDQIAQHAAGKMRQSGTQERRKNLNCAQPN